MCDFPQHGTIQSTRGFELVRSNLRWTIVTVIDGTVDRLRARIPLAGRATGLAFPLPSARCVISVLVRGRISRDGLSRLDPGDGEEIDALHNYRSTALGIMPRPFPWFLGFYPRLVSVNPQSRPPSCTLFYPFRSSSCPPLPFTLWSATPHCHHLVHLCV